MSADLLRRAAAKLREHAEAATPGPWIAASETNRKNSIALVGALARRGSGEAIAVLAGDPRTRHADAHLIELMHPPVALALADLLDKASSTLAAAEADGWDYEDTETLPILALAQAVLREPGGSS